MQIHQMQVNCLPGSDERLRLGEIEVDQRSDRSLLLDLESFSRYELAVDESRLVDHRSAEKSREVRRATDDSRDRYGGGIDESESNSFELKRDTDGARAVRFEAGAGK